MAMVRPPPTPLRAAARRERRTGSASTAPSSTIATRTSSRRWRRNGRGTAEQAVPRSDERAPFGSGRAAQANDEVPFPLCPGDTGAAVLEPPVTKRLSIAKGIGGRLLGRRGAVQPCSPNTVKRRVRAARARGGGVPQAQTNRRCAARCGRRTRRGNARAAPCTNATPSGGGATGSVRCCCARRRRSGRWTGAATNILKIMMKMSG